MRRFCTFVITDSQPTKDDIEEAMKPFFNERWTWYQIGGRWTGYFTTYDPTKDPANSYKCERCGGSGVDPDAPDKKENKRISPFDMCKECKGQNVILKWPTEWVPYKDDSQPIDNPNVLNKKPYAIVWNGTWYENYRLSEITDKANITSWVTVLDTSNDPEPVRQV